jgi:hypothetical protein
MTSVLGQGLQPLPQQSPLIIKSFQFIFLKNPQKVLDKDSSTCYNKIDERRSRFLFSYDPLLKVFFD